MSINLFFKLFYLLDRLGRDIVRWPAVILSPELSYENKNLWI